MTEHEKWKAEGERLLGEVLLYATRATDRDRSEPSRESMLDSARYFIDKLRGHLDSYPLGDPVAWIAAKGEHVRTVKPGPSVVAMAGCSALYRDPRTVEVKG